MKTAAVNFFNDKYEPIGTVLKDIPEGADVYEYLLKWTSACYPGINYNWEMV